MTSAVRPSNFSLLGTLAVCTVMLLCSPLSTWGAAAKAEPDPTAPGLDDEDLYALQTLFEKMGDAFVHGNAKSMRGLLADSSERDVIVDTLKREFQEATYVDFQVERPTLDAAISETRYSVDVTIRVRILYQDDARRPDERKPIENTTFQNFIVNRQKNGAFTIVNSSFFDNMGRRSGGLRLFVHVLAAVIVFCAALAFWVWMASEAWWIRPRSTLWRLAMMAPPLGPLVFFFARYLPQKWKHSKRGS